MSLSYDCTELIRELKNDISEFGPSVEVDVKFSPLKIKDEFLAIDYDLHFNLNDPDLDDEDRTEILETDMPIAAGEHIEVMPAVDALLIFTKQSSVTGGLQYVRELIEEYRSYIKISTLIERYGINYANFKRFMSGDDTKLSEEKAITVFKVLLKRPIQ